MFILYDLTFLLIAVIYLPVYLLQRKFHRGFLMRLGMLPRDLKLNKPVWIHAVSVGEVMAVRNFIEEFRIAYPGKSLFISTVTPTGNKIACNISREGDFVSYLPLDLSFIVRKVIDNIRPLLFVLVETEIWPNLITYLYKNKIPIVVVNGRISDRSFKGYLVFRFLLKPILDKINLFCVQGKSDAERLIRMGVEKNRIQVTGNMKFDGSISLTINPESIRLRSRLSPEPGRRTEQTPDFSQGCVERVDNADYADRKNADYADKYRALLKLNEEDKLWVAGSTHPEEEEIVLEAYKELLTEFPKLKLLIAPRHPERASQIDEIVSRLGFRTVLTSALPLQPCNCITQPVFILDTIGELIGFYSIASVVFVGGSLIKKGGHNILEPAAQGKPVIFGPHMFNFRDIASLFLENKACILANNKEELVINIRDLLNNPSRATELTMRARALISQNQGASRRNLEYIKPYLAS